jgi:hypothetical protein
LNYDVPTHKRSISGIEPTPIRTYSLSVAMRARLLLFSKITLSPSTHRVSISSHGALRIMEVRSSDYLLEALGISLVLSSLLLEISSRLLTGTVSAFGSTLLAVTSCGTYMFRNSQFPSQKISLSNSPRICHKCSPVAAFSQSPHYFQNLSSVCNHYPPWSPYRNGPRDGEHYHNHQPPPFTTPSPVRRHRHRDRRIGDHWQRSLDGEFRKGYGLTVHRREVSGGLI